MKFFLLLIPIVSFALRAPLQGQSLLHQMQPVPFSAVRITDEFWKPKIDKVAVRTLSACIYQTEVATPRIRNFEKVARKKGEKHEGIFYDDSDVYKALEAMAYSLKNHPDSALEKKCDEWIDKIAAAQQEDGYLNTFYTLNEPQNRYSDMSMHEDYNCGHLIEAAVAYFQSTGKRKLLQVAIRWADHFDRLFGPGKRHWVTGHQELELALVKLFRITGDRKYLNLSNWLLSERGHGYAKGYTWTDWKDTGYAQDLLPVKDQTQITGHAVRAMYMYTGAADVAAFTGDEAYVKAMKIVWEDVVYRNMYITGGIGSAGSNEGFSQDYDLPNEQAYCETCASVGMVFWNQRMNLLTGESKYIDVLEKCLYNGALDGLSLSGDRFFYGNPLASRGQHQRREWFGTACCPANIARLVASVGDYIYTKSDRAIGVNLFIGSEAQIRLGDQQVGIRQQTSYPWEPSVKLTVSTKRPQAFSLLIRKPQWSGDPDQSLYLSSAISDDHYAVTVNGKPVDAIVENGYLKIERKWKNGDQVDYHFSMPVGLVRSKTSIQQNEDRLAIQRGPLVYCVEGSDNENKAWNIILPATTSFTLQPMQITEEKVIAVQAQVPVISVADGGTQMITQERKITAIPYYTWANRGKNEMQVWLPTRIKDIKINYIP